MKDKYKGFLIVSGLLAAVGLVLIFQSVKFGTSLADSWIAERGGANTDYYHIIVESYIQAFHLAGGVLLGAGILLSGYFGQHLTKKYS